MRQWMLIAFAAALPAVAAVKAWTPIQFFFDPSPVSKALEDLRQNHDPVYEEMQRRAPGFEAEFAQSFASGFDFMAAQMMAPKDIFREDNYGQDLAMEALSKIVKPTDWRPYFELAATMEQLIPKRLGTMKAEKQHSYRFCELNSTAKICENWPPEQQYYFGYLAEILARRIISQPSFVEGICGQTVPLLKWYLKWHELTDLISKSEWRTNLTATFDQVDKSLTLVYGDGTWDTTVYDKRNMSDSMEFIFRRYLDGGPRVIESMRSCLNLLRQETANSLVIDASPKASDVFAKALDFRDVGFINRPNHKITVQSRRFTKEAVAQITHLVEDPLTLGPVRDLGGFDETELKDIFALTAWMSAADARYDYRVITGDELQQTFPNLKDVCYVNHDYLLYGNKGLELQPKARDCKLTSLILVRVEK